MEIACAWRRCIWTCHGMAVESAMAIAQGKWCKTSVRWNELRIILWMGRVGTVSLCPRVTVKNGGAYETHRKVLVDKRV